MAIYHFSVESISRSDGRSAVACAAYRAGEQLYDERYGKVQDYSRKKGIEFKKIYAPENTNIKLMDRNKLWNTVEQVERRSDSNLAREFEIAFPCELDKIQREKMLNEICEHLVKRHDVIVDAVIHAPHTKRGSDKRNYHAHIMFTGRQIDLTTGDFAQKRNRDFNKENSSQTVSEWRAYFATTCNKYLEEAGSLERVDHRSYKDQNSQLTPTIHEGPQLTQLRRKGIDTEITLKNDLIKDKNLKIKQDQQLIVEIENEIHAAMAKRHQLENTLSQVVQEQERKRLEDEARIEKMNHAYNQFIELEAIYIEFSESYYNLNQGLNYGEERLDRLVEKSNKWVDKNVIGAYRHYDGLFYDSYHHNYVHIDTPSFYLTERKSRLKKDELKKKYLEDVAKLAKQHEIERVIEEMKVYASILEANNMERPKPKTTIWDKITRKYIHSFDNISNYEAHAKVDIQTYYHNLKEEELALELKNKEEARRNREERKQRDEEYKIRESWGKNADLRRKQRLLYENSLVSHPTKDKSNDNDFSP